MFIAEFAKRVGRSVDTVKSWDEQGLLTPSRDGHDRRVYREEDVPEGVALARLGITARRQNRKLASLVAAAPKQLALLVEARSHS